MESELPSILVVDDDPLSLFTLERYFQKHYKVITAYSGASAMEVIQGYVFDLIILDIILPDVDGLTLCRQIKAMTGNGGTPIIFISSVDDTIGKLNGFAAGAVDYITKPFILDEVMSRARTQIDLNQLRRGLEERVKQRTKELEAEMERRFIAESALLKLSTAVIQAPLTIMIVGTDGLIEYVNPWFTKSTGYQPEEVIGQNPRLLKSGYTTHVEYASMWKTITSGAIWRGEFSTVRKNGGHFWESVTMAPVKNASGDIINYVGIKEDITVRKQRDNELLAAKVKAESGSKAKSDFLTMVSHELRTPLNAVIGFSEFMTMELHGPLGDSQYSEYARVIADAGRSLLNIVEQIIDLTQVEAGRLTVRNDVIVVQDAIDEAHRFSMKAKGVRCTNVNIQNHCEVALLHGDQQLFRQILVNLISNAMIFTPQGGQIGINLQMGFNNVFEIVIRDNGEGICANNLHRVLEPFEQAENIMTRSHDGLGLGLPLAKLMTEAHGGALKLESTLGIGTKVTIRIPKERIIKI